MAQSVRSNMSDGLLTPDPQETFAPPPTPSNPLAFPFVFLPPFVKQHVPKLANVYRTASGRNNRDIKVTDNQRAQWAHALETPGTITPPPSYAEVANPSVYTAAELLQHNDQTSAGNDNAETGASTRSPAPAAQPIAVKRTLSGINRKYSRQGLNLLALSAQEAASRASSTSPPSSSSTTSTPFSRQLYIHSLTYLLRGLPENLTDEELVSLRCALPRPLDSSTTPLTSNAHSSSHGSHDSRTSYFGSYNGYSDPSTSYLHRLISATTIRIFMFVSLLMPYIQAGIAWMYRFERKHHVSERIFSGTVHTADTLGKRAVTLTAAIWGLNEGKVGATVQEAAFWVVRGVSGGLCQGVGQGMEMLGPGSTSRSGSASSSYFTGADAGTSTGSGGRR